MAERPRVLVLNGPNLNLLGKREPEIYGSATLADVEADCIAVGDRLGLEVTCRQSNHEGELVTWVQEARGAQQALVVNAGAYTHTSLALHDALRACALPAIEVHLSNIHQREDFRRHSYVALAAVGMICGLGPLGYELALRALAARLGAVSKDKEAIGSKA
ncbi:MAG: type II 3-dehydroquinate dehydratase [Tistlia sp.]|uniref:type II 3-dehydroquinate dehydratase n=1 Tax=Tistlia sp. TaxID=3057121 RepID=UPI0034A246E5